MTYVRFTRLFEHKDPDTGRRTRYPSGWSGEVAAGVEEAAGKAGALAVDLASAVGSEAPINPGITPAPNRPLGDGTNPADPSGQGGQGGQDGPVISDAMTKAELEAEAQRRGVTVPSGATKADIIALLTA